MNFYFEVVTIVATVVGIPVGILTAWISHLANRMDKFEAEKEKTSHSSAKFED